MNHPEDNIHPQAPRDPGTDVDYQALYRPYSQVVQLDPAVPVNLETFVEPEENVPSSVLERQATHHSTENFAAVADSIQVPEPAQTEKTAQQSQAQTFSHAHEYAQARANQQLGAERRTLGQPVAPIVNVENESGIYTREPVTFWGYVGVVICFVTSYLFCLFGLSFLLTCAFFSSLKKKHKHKKKNKRLNIVPPHFPKLDKTNRKLKPDLAYYAEARGYKMEELEVTTSDGFIVKVQHLINPNDTPAVRASRYPVVMLHGLLQAAAAYATSGEHSLAFFMLESGYDVWLANNRNGFKPKHTNYKYLDLRMWSWRISEMGTRDLPAIINFICEQTGSAKVALVAHSQGTTQTFLALSRGYMPELGDKISAFVALAPAVYGGKLLDRYFLRWVRHLSLKSYRLFFGHHGFFSIMMQMRRIIPYSFFGYCGKIMFSYLFEWNDYLWDSRYNGRQFIFSPVYVSSELMYWWVGKGGFADRGCIFTSEDPTIPWYDEHLPPVCIVVPGLDDLVNPHKLVDRFHNVECRLVQHDIEIVNVPEYSHVDVLWAIDTIEKVGMPMSSFIWRTRHKQEGREWMTPSYANVHVPSETS
ncbi:uncharacterized protein SAPINGB_P002112 [Magnusiomyces paraingens]|uniref:Partial AB-hydrolase lipase domain-containing protein n=1 Tax=Magnusiomyces paraingens TaxID=2606893 RepID=A0A5E8BEH7_9ASCO|nr:uncharacterized protein SAPINGB_P002112 [Saprochaete ingens]VVT49117.1 unnamed protein product [Saprochaete ingens]